MHNPGWDFRLEKRVIIHIFATICEKFYMDCGLDNHVVSIPNFLFC